MEDDWPISFFLTTLFIIAFICLIGYFLSSRRIDMVYEYRKELLTEISRLADEDIKNGREWKWRYEVLESVDLNEMMSKFWKPLDSFYPDKSFLK